MNSDHWQVSADGGTRPLWSHDGQELFYLSPEAAVIRVGVERGPVCGTTPPTVVVKAGYYAPTSNNYGRTYDISPDGQRFLLIKEGGVEPTSAPPQIIVVQHWVEELKRLVPTQ